MLLPACLIGLNLGHNFYGRESSPVRIVWSNPLVKLKAIFNCWSVHTFHFPLLYAKASHILQHIADSSLTLQLSEYFCLYEQDGMWIAGMRTAEFIPQHKNPLVLSGVVQYVGNIVTARLLSQLFSGCCRCTHHCQRVFNNPEWTAIAPSELNRVMTTCPPESLFIARVCLRAEHHPYSTHSAVG